MKALFRIVAFFVGVVGLQGQAAQFWSPKALQELPGYFSYYDVACNKQGRAIAVFEDNILGEYVADRDSWQFFTCSYDTLEISPLQIGQERPFSLGVTAQQKTVLLNAEGNGFVLTCLKEGPYAGRLVAIGYKEGHFAKGEVLSEGKAIMPVVAGALYDKTIAVWIHAEESSPDYLSLMASYYDGSSWKSQGVISEYKSIAMSYRQSAPQEVMNDFGDAVVVWKVRYNPQKEEQPALMVTYYDGIDHVWLASEELSPQHPDKKSFSLAGNGNGDVLVAWESEQGVEASFLNSTEWIARAAGLRAMQSWNKEVTPAYLEKNEWMTTTLAQGNMNGAPQAAINSQGIGQVIWLEGYEGVRSACFKVYERKWTDVNQVVSSKAAYTLNLTPCDPGKMLAVWIAENGISDERVQYSFFDPTTQAWAREQTLYMEGQTLVDHLQALSIVDGNHGMLLWYDFFKESLYVSQLREAEDLTQQPELEVKRTKMEGRAYQKKMELVQRRRDRSK